MRYVTRDGVEIEVGRVDRRRLDRISLPEPAPPTHSVETWGGIVEQVPDYNNASYIRSFHKWRTNTLRENLKVIIDALEFAIPDSFLEEQKALNAIGIGDGTKADYLRHGINERDQVNIIALVHYQSTVTVRGVVEAEKSLNYTWRGKPLSSWSIGYSYGKRGQLGVDIHTALRSGLRWSEFCELSGQEQSQLVAFWNLEDSLQWLLSQR